MPQKKHKPEEIVVKLRQVDVLLSQGRSVGEAVRMIGVTQFTYYRWRKEFGGLKGDQVKRLKELEKENGRLRKAVSEAVSQEGRWSRRSYRPGFSMVKITVLMRTPTSAKLSGGRSFHWLRQPGRKLAAHARNFRWPGVSLTSAEAGRIARSVPPGFVDCRGICPFGFCFFKGLADTPAG